MTFDTLGWVDLQHDASGNVTNAIFTAFDMSQSTASNTNCGFLGGLMDGTETFTDGWYFEKVAIDNTAGISAGSYTLGDGDAIAVNLSGSSVADDLVFQGTITLDSFSQSSGSMVLGSVSLSSGSASVTGSNVTMCNCPSLDPDTLAQLANVR